MNSLTEIAFNKVINEGQGGDVIDDIKYKMMNTESKCLVISDILEREGFNKNTIKQIEKLNLDPYTIFECVINSDPEASLYYYELYLEDDPSDMDIGDLHIIFNDLYDKCEMNYNYKNKYCKLMKKMVIDYDLDSSNIDAYRRWDFNLRIFYNKLDEIKINTTVTRVKYKIGKKLEEMFIDIVRHINYICKDMKKKCLDREFKNVETAMKYIYEVYEKYKLKDPSLDFFSLEKAVGNPDYYKNYMEFYNSKRTTDLYTIIPELYTLIPTDEQYRLGRFDID